MNKFPINTPTNNLLYFSEEYKPNGLFTSRPTTSNVMNIVNNLHSNNDNQSGRNKNVEINFNKYEIKILSNKPTSAKSIRIKKQEQTQNQSHQQYDKANKVEDAHQKDSNKDNKQIVTKPIKSKSEQEQIQTNKNSSKTSLVVKPTSYDNESSDVPSSNLIYLKSIKESKVLKFENGHSAPTYTNTDNDNGNGNDKQRKEEISLSNQEKEKKKESITLHTTRPDNTFINNYNHPVDSPRINNDKNDNNIGSSFLRNIKIISGECDIVLNGNTNVYKKEASKDNNPFIEIINERNSQEDGNEEENDSNDLSGLILSKTHNNHILKLKNLSLEKSRDKKNNNDSRSIKKEEGENVNCNNISIILRPRGSDAHKSMDCENILSSSSESPVDKTKTKQSFDKLFSLSSLKNTSKTEETNKQEIASIEPFNQMSSTFNSSSNVKQKDFPSTYSFFNKKASSVVLSSQKKKVRKQNSNIQFKLQNQLQPKKNKRFLRQLSKISENANQRLSLNQQKIKLFKSFSSPLQKNKLSNAYFSHNNPSKKFSYTTPETNPTIMFTNHQDSIIIMKKKSVIKEVEKSSQSENSIKISVYSSVEDKSDQEDRNKLKKGSVISKSTNSIVFVDLRVNSVRVGNDISKCTTLVEKSFCQPFIEKQLNDIEMLQTNTEENAIEEKNDLLSKIMLVIDIKCDRIEERRRRTLTQYANKTLLQLEDQKRLEINDFIPGIEYSNENMGKPEPKTIDEPEFYYRFNTSYVFTDQKVLFSPFTEKYFEFNLLYHLHREKYLDEEIVSQPDSFVPNFSKRRKIFKRQKTSLNSISSDQSKCKKKNNHLYSNKNHLKTLYGYNAAFCFRFIKNDDITFGDNEMENAKIKLKIAQMKNSRPLNARISLRKKESRSSIFSNTKKKSQLFRNSNSRLSFISKKSIEEMIIPINSLQRKDSILNKHFFCRNKDAKQNLKAEGNEISSNKRISNRISLSRKKEELFTSPLKVKAKAKKRKKKKEISKSPTHIVNRMLTFNKETVMSQTHEIKSRILTKMKNYVDSLFFYIKDGSYQNFKDLFFKYKVNTEIRDTDGNTFLNIAVQCDCLRITKFLIDNGSNVNSQNIRLNSPLHYALCYQNYAIADILIKSGANEIITNKFGLTPWQCINSASTNI